MGKKRTDRPGNARRHPGKEKSSWHAPVQPGKASDMVRVLRPRAAWRWLSAFIIVVICSPASARIDGHPATGELPGQVQTGSLLLRMKSGYATAAHVNTDIEARVSGLVARVRVRQEFRNNGLEWVDGLYVFPLPDTAAVDRLRMYIGERFIEGEIREKQQAKKEFEAAKAAGRKASLVEQERANLFTTSVANIAPGETVSVEIEYLETLRIDEGTFSIRFPLTATPRYIPGTPLPGRKGSGWSPDTTAVIDASRITPPVVTHSTDHKVSFRLDLNAGVPLEFVASRYHPVNVNRTDDRYAIGFSGNDVPMDHDVELTWKPVPAASPRAMIFTESVDGEPHIMLMLLPPDDLSAPQQPTPRELLLIIDTSGSMHGTSLDQAKRAISLALAGLRPGDRFNVIQFNSVTSALFANSVAATTRNISVATRYVSALSANGGTEMRPAIQQALATPETGENLRQVIFVTDGSVGNEEELFSLIERQLGSARLFTVGIGSAPNSWFMRRAAEFGRGTYTFISALHEVNEKMGRLFRKLEQPQITDITVEWPGGVIADSYPENVPDLYSGEPVFMRARLTAGMRESDMVVIRGNSATGSWNAELPLEMSEPGSGIAALWARARIEDLQDRKRRGADAETTRKSVIETALTHHLVSRYTSLVAVDKTPVRPASENSYRAQVPGMLPYGQSTEAIFGFPATATSAGFYRLSGFALIAVALLLLALIRRRPDHVVQTVS